MLGFGSRQGYRGGIAIAAAATLIGLGMSPAAAHDPQARGEASAIRATEAGQNGLLSQVFGPVLDGGTCESTWNSSSTEQALTDAERCGDNLELSGPNGQTAFTQEATTDVNRHVEARATVAPVRIGGLGEGLDLNNVFAGIDAAVTSQVLDAVFGALDCTDPGNAALCALRQVAIDALNPLLQGVLDGLTGVVDVEIEVGAVDAQAEADPDFIYADAVKQDGTYDSSALVRSDDTTETPASDDLPSGASAKDTGGFERVGVASGNAVVDDLTVFITLVGATAPQDRVLPPIVIPVGTDPNTPLLVSPVDIVPQILEGLGASLQDESGPLEAILVPLGGGVDEVNEVITEILEQLEGPLDQLAEGLEPILEGTVNKQDQIGPGGEKTPADVRDGVAGPMPAVEITALDVEVLQDTPLSGTLRLGRVAVDPHRDFARGGNPPGGGGGGGGGDDDDDDGGDDDDDDEPKVVDSGINDGGNLGAIGIAGLLAASTLIGSAARQRLLLDQ